MPAIALLGAAPHPQPRSRSGLGSVLYRRVLMPVSTHPRYRLAVTTLLAPTYIPVEVCGTVGLDAGTPLEKCMDAVQVDVAKDGIAAPAADVAGLQKVVAGAQDRGLDLKVIVMEKSPPLDTPLRDIATQVGQQHPGSTVLVLSPGWAGSYSTTYDRVLLEAGQDVAKLTPDPVQGAQNFVDQLNTPDFPWIAFTMVLVFAVSAAAVAIRFLQRSAKRKAHPKT